MQKKYLINDILKGFICDVANNSEVPRNDLNELLTALNTNQDIDLAYCELRTQLFTIEKTKENLIKLCDMLHFSFNGQQKINNLQLMQELIKHHIQCTSKETTEIIFSNSEVDNRIKKVYKDNTIIMRNAYFSKCNAPRYTTVIDIQKTLAHFEKMLNKL